MATVSVKNGLATVKWYDEKKGFGFFQAEDFASDIFFHRSALEAGGFAPSDMQEGFPAVISFETGKNGKVQVTAIHEVTITYVKKAGAAAVVAAPAAVATEEAVLLSLGEIYTGVVVKVEAGFGFIKVEGIKKLVFFHFSKLVDQLMKPKTGQNYTFTAGLYEKGPGAMELALVVDEVSTAGQSDQVVEVKAEPAEVPAKPKLKRAPRKSKVGESAASAQTAAVASAPDEAVIQVVAAVSQTCEKTSNGFASLGDLAAKLEAAQAGGVQTH